MDQLKVRTKLKTGDQVIVITGRDKGKIGVVTRKLKLGYLLVEGIHLLYRTIKSTAEQQGGIIRKEGPIHVSNVAIYNPKTKKADRIGYRFLEDGKKVRFFKSNEELIEI